MHREDGSLRGMNVLVAGGGVFGSRAAANAKSQGARVLVVDVDEGCKARDICGREAAEASFVGLEEGEACFVGGAALGSVVHCLDDEAADFIAPCIPGHVAALAAENWLQERGFSVRPAPDLAMDVLRRMDPELVLRFDKMAGRIISSHMPAGSLCSSVCSQPADRCQVTGKKKEARMDELLRRATVGADRSLVITTELVGEGVGCFEKDVLSGFLQDLENAEGALTVALGTSCCCHGIMHVYELFRP